MLGRRLPGLILFAGAAALAQAAEMPKQDTVKGAKDHPLLSRFDGARLVGYDVKQFDEAMIPTGKRLNERNHPTGFEKVLKLEGRYSRYAYIFPEDRSSLEVMRNYQTALEKAGMKAVFACAKEECGSDFGEYFADRRDPNSFLQGGGVAYEPFIYGRQEPRYQVSAGKRPDGSALTVAVVVYPPAKGKNGGVFVDVVEGKPMESGKGAASLNAADMAKGIAAEGKVAVYGVYFDTAKADVKPESAPALAEMAKLLQQDPKLKVFVVGHTDNQGDVSQNLALSQRRADAVVKTLADGHKIDVKRLSPKGVAAYAPLASNRAEAGRQKNRRVELVEQ